MKTLKLCALFAAVSLSACASTSGTESSGGDVTQMVGALMGAVLGGATSYKTGNAAQGQEIMSSVWKLFGVTEAAHDTSSDDSWNPDSSSLLASNSGGGTSSGSSSHTSESTGTTSAVLQNADSKSFEFAPPSCPSDLQGARSQISNPDLLQDESSFKQTIDDMVSKAGGYDIAIASVAAQRIATLQAAHQAADTARQVWTEQGDFGDVSDCPQAEGIYCSAVHTMWAYSDAVVIYKYTEAALQCRQLLEARK